MNPFKGVSGGRRKRKKVAKVEIKQEPTIKEEPTTDDGVDSISRPGVDGTYRAIYNGSFNPTCDFNEVKEEIKLEEEETKGEEKESKPCEGSNVSTTKKSTSNVS